MKTHRWSGWPGAICLDCGSENPMEIALADNWYDPITDTFDTEEHKIEIMKCLECFGNITHDKKDS